MAKLKHREEELQMCLARYIRYERTMLAATYTYLELDHGWIINNALIESFSVHARNLIDFYRGKQDFLASEFTNEPYKPEYVSANTGKVGNKLYAKLNEQIVHISKKRTIIYSEKIGPSDRILIVDALAQEWVHFRSKLKNQYKDLVGTSDHCPENLNVTADYGNSALNPQSRPTGSASR